MEICQDPEILNVTLTIIKVIKIVFIVAPLILIIAAGTDFFLSIISNDEDKLKKATNTAIKRMIICISLFFVPTIIIYLNSLLIDLNIATDYSACITNANPEYIAQRRIDIADEYLKIAREKDDMASVVEAEKYVMNISNNSEKEKRLNEINAMKTKIREREKEEEEKYESSNNSNHLKFYNSLSVLHAGQSRDNTNELFEAAGKAKFYAAECDLRLNGGTLYCAHETAPSMATKFEDYISKCKKYNMKALLDLKWPSNPNWNIYGFYTMVDTLARYIKDHNLQNTVIVQTSNITAMNKINNQVSNVKYWYLVADYQGTTSYNTLISDMSSFKKAGVVAVNMTKALATEDRIKTIQNNNLKLCIYSVNDDASRLKFSNYGAEYIMTDLIP